MNSRLDHIMAKMPTSEYSNYKKYLCPKGKKVVQFSMGRTGSTLIGRILKHIYPEDEIILRHPDPMEYSNAIQFNQNVMIVSSYRHPIDSTLSLIRVQEYGDRKIKMKSVDDDILNKHIDDRRCTHARFKQNMEDHKGPQLKLKYEIFWNDYDYIFDNLEKFFKIEIDKEHRKDIGENCGIKNTVKIQKSLMKNMDKSFRRSVNWSHMGSNLAVKNSLAEAIKTKNYFYGHDEETQVHGNHIMTPEPYNYKLILTPEQIDVAEEQLSEAIEEWKIL